MAFVVGLSAFVFSSNRVSATPTPDFAKKLGGEPCKTCHTMKPLPKKGEPSLNYVGACFQEKKTDDDEKNKEILKECKEKKEK